MMQAQQLPGRQAPMHWWTVADGLKIAGDSWGDPSGPLVLLLHGGGQTRHAWGGTGARLGQAGYYAIAFDARGHGDSDWSPNGDYSQDAMIGDLATVLANTEMHGAVIVGASMGGATGLAAVGENRVDASALILVDIVPSTEAAGVARIQAFMNQRPEGFDSLDEVADAISRYRPERPRPRTLDGLAKNVRIGQDGKYRWHWDPRFMAHQSDRLIRRQRLAASARRITVPTLLVRGGSSDVVSEAGVQEFLELCQHAEYVNVNAAGHMVAGDRNDAFGEAALDFLLRHADLLPQRRCRFAPQQCGADF